MDFLALQAAIRRDDLFTSPHSLSEALADNLAIDEVWQSVMLPTADVIEDYPNDPRGPSCLILTFVHGRPVHCVVAFPSKRYAAARQAPSIAFMVTVYRPDLRTYEWAADFRTRRAAP